MKILHILYSFGCGGAERFVADLANMQSACGNKVSVCIIRPSTPENTYCCRFLASAVNFHSLELESGIRPAKIRAVSSYISGVRPEILHCHHNVIPYVASFLAFNRNTKVIHTVHSEAHRANVSRFEYLLCRYFYRCGRVLPVAISGKCLESFVSVYKLKPFLVNNGRSVDSTTDRLPSVREELAQFRRTPGTKLFIHVSRCHPVKNQKALFDAFRMLDSQNVPAELIVIGDGFKDSECAMNLPDNVHLLGLKENVADYLVCSDAFCLTSFSEGLSISLLEAISFGLTPVCTPVGGNTDVVRDGVTGYLSADTAAESIADALKRCADKPIDRKVLMDFHDSCFSMRACYDRYQSIYQEGKI